MNLIIAQEQKDLIAYYNQREPHYPSIVDSNNYGLCLRAAIDLPSGTLVATADFEHSENPYIADHPNPEYKYVALVTVNPKAIAGWGRVRGKWAFCNHSCNPNCDIKPGWLITTNRYIKKGEELTTSYDAYVPNFPWPETWNFTCICSTPNCKGIIKEYRMDIIYPINSLP